MCYLRISWHYHGLHTSSQDRNKLNQGTTCDACDVETTFSGTCSVTECATTTTTAIAATRTRTAAAGLDCATARLVACSAAATVGVAVGAATATATAAVTPTSTSPKLCTSSHNGCLITAENEPQHMVKKKTLTSHEGAEECREAAWRVLGVRSRSFFLSLSLSRSLSFPLSGERRMTPGSLALRLREKLGIRRMTQLEMCLRSPAGPGMCHICLLSAQLSSSTSLRIQNLAA